MFYRTATMQEGILEDRAPGSSQRVEWATGYKSAPVMNSHNSLTRARLGLSRRGPDRLEELVVPQTLSTGWMSGVRLILDPPFQYLHDRANLEFVFVRM